MNTKNTLLLNAAVLALLAGCAEEPAAVEDVIRPIRSMTVGDPTQLSGRTFPGKAKAVQEVELSFRVGGPLMTRPVDLGDEVGVGFVVARIDPRDFEVELRNVTAQVAEAKATSSRATSDYNRLARLYKEDPGATSEAAIDRARNNRDSATAIVESLQAAVAAANDRLDYTYLRAPFDGDVVSIYVENFEEVQAGQPIMRIINNDRIEMVVNIPESLISYAPQVQGIHITFSSFPDVEVPATIKEIGTEASSTTRTYPITLIMDQPEAVTILPGMAGTLFTKSPPVAGQASLEIPIGATLSEEGGASYVWIVDESTSTVSQREIVVGRLSNFGITVESGLSPGDRIATAGVHYLREGQKVRLDEAKSQR